MQRSNTEEERRCLEWVNEKLGDAGEPPVTGDVFDAFKDGLVLANLLESLGAGKVKVNKMVTIVAVQLDNLQSCMRAIRKLDREQEMGIGSISAMDFFKGNKKPIKGLLFQFMGEFPMNSDVVAKQEAQVKRASRASNRAAAAASLAKQQEAVAAQEAVEEAARQAKKDERARFLDMQREAREAEAAGLLRTSSSPMGFAPSLQHSSYALGDVDSTQVTSARMGELQRHALRLPPGAKPPPPPPGAEGGPLAEVSSSALGHTPSTVAVEADYMTAEERRRMQLGLPPLSKPEPERAPEPEWSLGKWRWQQARGGIKSHLRMLGAIKNNNRNKIFLDDEQLALEAVLPHLDAICDTILLFAELRTETAQPGVGVSEIEAFFTKAGQDAAETARRGIRKHKRRRRDGEQIAPDETDAMMAEVEESCDSVMALLDECGSSMTRTATNANTIEVAQVLRAEAEEAKAAVKRRRTAIPAGPSPRQHLRRATTAALLTADMKLRIRHKEEELIRRFGPRVHDADIDLVSAAHFEGRSDEVNDRFNPEFHRGPEEMMSPRTRKAIEEMGFSCAQSDQRIHNLPAQKQAPPKPPPPPTNQPPPPTHPPPPQRKQPAAPQADPYADMSPRTRELIMGLQGVEQDFQQEYRRHSEGK